MRRMVEPSQQLSVRKRDSLLELTGVGGGCDNMFFSYFIVLNIFNSLHNSHLAHAVLHYKNQTFELTEAVHLMFLNIFTSCMLIT